MRKRIAPEEEVGGTIRLLCKSNIKAGGDTRTRRRRQYAAWLGPTQRVGIETNSR